ncbi:MAG: glutamyl-tRNA reductase [Thermoplasmata archaeon]
MQIINLQATYKNMDFLDLEKWNSLDDKDIVGFLKLYADEFVILKTCNRFEIYIVCNDEIAGKLSEYLLSLGPKAEIATNRDAIIHLMRVSAGLDSMIPGEHDIQRQVKEALNNALKNKISGKVLNYVFMSALNVSKEIRTNTKISNGVISIPQTSVRILNEIKKEGKVAILGTGRVAHSLLKYLGNQYDITVFGRSMDKLEDISNNFHVKTKPWTHLGEISNFDVLFSALKVNGYVLNNEDLSTNKPEIIIDLGNPRNIEPSSSRYYIDLGYLKTYVEKNLNNRKKEMDKAMLIINERVKEIEHKIFNERIEKVISSIYQKAENIKKEEIDELIKIIGDKHKEEIELFANSLVKKLLNNIVKNLQDDKYDSDKIKIIEKIFR